MSAVLEPGSAPAPPSREPAVGAATEPGAAWALPSTRPPGLPGHRRRGKGAWWAVALAACLLAVLAGWPKRSGNAPNDAMRNAAASELPAERVPPLAATALATPAPMGARTVAAVAAESIGTVASAKAPADALPQRIQAAPGSPEARLLHVYALMAEAQGDKALDEARRLTQDVPNFALAHLVYADLLKARTAPLPQFGATAASASASVRDAPGEPTPAERLKELSAEARARVGSANFRPPAGAVPAQFVYVAPSVKHAIAVDASRSRLYVFENSASGMVLKRDFYASVGKLGTAKRVEGDLRTPLGVYFVTGRLSKKKLADRYGASAMVLNYPNQYDLLRGRTGSGIWLHGVESSYFSRAPLATDGCVALSNIDLLALTQDVDRQATPVVIAERIEWVAPASAAKPPERFTQALDAWRAARQAENPAAELDFYAADARYATGTAGIHWVDALRAERSRPGSGARQLTPLSVMAWHDEQDVMLVTYSETTARDAQPRLKRQYWLRRDDGWRIVFDGAVG